MPQPHLINVQYRKYDDKMTLAIVVTTMMMREREVLGITAVMYTGGCHTQSVPRCTHQDHDGEEEEEEEDNDLYSGNLSR